MRSLPPGHRVVTIRLSPSPGRKGIERDAKIPRIDAERRERATRTEHAQCRLKRLLASKRLDRDVHAASTGDLEDFGNRIGSGKVDDMVRAHVPAQRGASRHALDTDDRGGAHQARTGGGAKANRPLREDRHRVADPDPPDSAPEKPVDRCQGTSAPVRRSDPPGRREIGHCVGTSRYSACAPSIVLPKRQPPSPSSRDACRHRTGINSPPKQAFVLLKA